MHGPFSAAARARHWRSLDAAPWDVAVVGGGITGAGVARDAAGRGLRVALLEAGDFAQGTSSLSSRLVHGGLRYLETYDFRLVFEALAERARLLRLAPHLVRPQAFVFPLYRGGPVGYRTLQAGMWLYDALALFRGIGRHRMLSAAALHAGEPALRTDGLIGGARYHDAAVDDARLTLANARGAHEAGAAVVPRARVVGFLREGGRIAGVRARDARTGEERDVRATVVVNATGPASDAVRRLADPAARPRLRPTKGVHLMVPRERLPIRDAVTFRSPVDGRVMFLLPWGDFAYVGTTDTDHAGDPEEVRADAADLRYLLDSANGIVPGAALTEADVVSTWAGLRPLLAPARATGESATSREHAIWWEGEALLNVAGGKLTTYRSMAAEVVDAAARRLKAAGVESGVSPTPHLPLPGAPDGPWAAFVEETARAAEDAGLGAEAGRHLAARHGEDAGAVLALAREDAALAARVVPARPTLWAEVVHAVRAEMALTVEDVLVRRTHLRYETRDGAASVAGAVAARMAREDGIGWDAAETAREAEAYRRRVAAPEAAA